jgi:hypothetical protein
MKEITLPSGAVLRITPSPFADAKALYQALLREAKGIRFNSATEMSEVFKDFFCLSFSSPEVERCLWECLKRCQYCDRRGDLKIDKDTFEPIEARGDYTKVCAEVTKENVLPFVKSLYVEYETALSMTEKSPS